MSLSITAYRKRTCILAVTVNGSDGTPESFAAGDVMRVKIGRDGKTPKLDLDSASPSANGSSLSSANPSTLRLDQDDLDFTPGIYDIEVSIVDDSDADAIKHAEKGTFILHDTQDGDLALT